MPGSSLGTGYIAVNNKNNTKQTSTTIELEFMLNIKYPVKDFNDAVLLIAPLSVELWTLELTQGITAKA